MNSNISHTNRGLDKSLESFNADLHRLAKQQLQEHAGARTFKIYHQQQAFWIKQSQIAHRRIWHWLGAVVAILSRNPLLKPTVATGGPEALKAEANRLRKLAALGVSVPQIVAEGKDWFMLNDIGRPLTGWIRDPEVSREQKRTIVKKASEQLALLHSQGLWHGRPAFRDMAYDGQFFGFLDFEEDPGGVLTPAQCMLRDALLYFHSLHRYLADDRPMILEAIELYRQLAPKSMWCNTLSFARQVWLIYGLLALLHRYLGKDAKYAYQTLKTLRNYGN
jgi:tRNA A-37 threonylcarbamoyl transferase component Bud32